ncbi:hypothetical protein PS887_03175 [Pseudomonas fluorescens]|nr:hypothetical protein SAMN04490210_0648 [Pseudomonas sp. bs2935]VVP08293.1 hypothetical protein PS887_03175 [Pseudomonas fluorescens]
MKPSKIVVNETLEGTFIVVSCFLRFPTTL